MEAYKTAIEASDAWLNYIAALQPDSALRYKQTVVDYLDYCEDNSKDYRSEDSFVAYVNYLHTDETFACSTLWSVSSIIASFFEKVFKSVNPLRANQNLKSLLHLWEKSEIQKQAKCFTKENIYTTKYG